MKTWTIYISVYWSILGCKYFTLRIIWDSQNGSNQITDTSVKIYLGELVQLLGVLLHTTEVLLLLNELSLVLLKFLLTHLLKYTTICHNVLHCKQLQLTIIVRSWAKYRGLSVTSTASSCLSRNRLKQLIDLRDSKFVYILKSLYDSSGKQPAVFNTRAWLQLCMNRISFAAKFV